MPVCALLAFAARPTLAQSGTEIIRGRVFGPDSLPLGQVEVLVTGLATRASQSARTNSNGVYTLVFANPEGDYIVAVRKIGFLSTSFRLSRTGISSILGSDVYLKSAVQTLATVVVEAPRLLPNGDRGAVGELGSSALADSIFLTDPSKLMALLLSIPGVFATDDSTFSVLGAAANQNITTLDGASVRGASLPPDALASTRVITSSADPARGGFAGANVSQTLRGGTDIFSATIRGSNANRALVWNDPEWTRPVTRSTNQSGTANGPIRKQRLRYNVSWNVNDNLSDWYSLLNPRGPLLAQQGISVDSVAAATAALQGLGVPLSLSSMPRNSQSRNYNTSEVFDFTPNATTSVRLSHSGNWNSSVGGGGSITAFPTRTNDVGSHSHYVATKFTGYVRGLLDELSLSVNYYADHSDPFTTLPGGSVRVGTDFSDGRTGLTSLGFGGGQGNYYEQSWYAYATDELSWIPKSGKHKLKVGGQLGFERSNYFFFPGSNLLGNYTYLSVADLAANKPAAYERVITDTPRKTQARNSALWIGEELTASKAWQLQGGLRFDFAYPTTTPRYNPAVEETFGIRTDRVPNDVGMSPRVGFSWSSKTRRGGGTSGGSSTLGGMSASAIASMSPELVTSLLSMQRSSTLPGIGVSGTVGAYRGVTSTGTIAELVESTGLPGTRVTVSCVGAAVPIPDWSTMTEGPAACADGTTGTTFSIARPLVRVFDPNFRAPLSWRGNVSLDGIRVPHKWIVGVSGVMAYNVNGQSAIDLNLNRAPLFHLPGEAERPVYVPLEAIVPGSGSISPGASRISSEFSSVSSVVSDLRGVSGQISASLAPPNPLFHRRVSLGLSYSLNAGRSESRGSSRVGTAGDPFAKQWVPNAQPLQTVRFTASGRVWWFNFGVTSYLYSGIPLTPLVSGDINGDGNGGNDRAFIPNPAAMSDSALANQLSELISHARPGARECLTSQLGKMAGANSCHTPWQARIDVSASITPPSSWGYNDRFRITMNVVNASGALVRALRLEDTPLGQTSLSTQPTSTLLYVTGFDPATQQFRYRVNQLFGEPTNYGSARRKFGPMQVQLGMEYKFGGLPMNPIARGLGLRESVNKPALTDAERRANVAKLKKDPTASFVQRKDSLSLSVTQLTQLSALSKEFDARADTALAPLTKWVVKKGTRVFDQDLSKKLSVAQSALGKLNTEFGKRAQAVLTPEQAARLKAPARATVPAQTARSGNPILPGWYADPEVHVFAGQYWIYPTYSAPYGQQTFMDAFSSPDLVTWTKHERVLDTANVSWARRAVWAPSIIEKDGWYYLFFGANDIQNDTTVGGIGVARSRSPEGPFKDYLGKPLIDKFHNGAQPIDQNVFRDRDGTYYIVYGGWRHCNIAKLNADFTGFVPFADGSTFKEITPAGYVEGAYMLLKDGKYYFMWSEGGWTGPNYAVAYAVGASPFGPFERVGKILQQDSTVATGAGHHSVVQSPASSKWYIVYHRRPLGETDRNHRVVSIDELRFDERGLILPVKITNAAVPADPLRKVK